MGSLNLFVLNREERKTAECDLSDYYVETMGIHDGWSLQVDFYHLHLIFIAISVRSLFSVISMNSRFCIVLS